MESGCPPAGRTRWPGWPDEIQRVIAQSLRQVSSLLPDYKVVSLAVPAGRLPQYLLLRGGVYEGEPYTLLGAVTPKGGMTATAAGLQFDPFRLPRAPVTELDAWGWKLADKSNVYYVSAGEALAEERRKASFPGANPPKNTKSGAHEFV